MMLASACSGMTPNCGNQRHTVNERTQDSHEPVSGHPHLVQHVA